MNKSLTSEEYSKVHKNTIGNFNISQVHKNALEFAGSDIRGKKILDLGCGNGELLFLAKQKGAIVFGIDFDAESITTARQNTTENDKIILGDVANMPYPDENFDFIFSLGTLGYLSEKDLERTSLGMHKKLRPGGLAIIRTSTKINLLGKIILKTIKKDYVSNTNFYTKKFLINMFKKIGFETVAIKRSSDRAKTNNIKDLCALLLKPFLASTWIILKK